MNRENYFPEGFIIGVILGLIIMYMGAMNYYRGGLIEYGCGQYSSQTGQFEWLKKVGGHDG